MARVVNVLGAQDSGHLTDDREMMGPGEEQDASGTSCHYLLSFHVIVVVS